MFLPWSLGVLGFSALNKVQRNRYTKRHGLSWRFEHVRASFTNVQLGRMPQKTGKTEKKWKRHINISFHGCMRTSPLRDHFVLTPRFNKTLRYFMLIVLRFTGGTCCHPHPQFFSIELVLISRLTWKRLEMDNDKLQAIIYAKRRSSWCNNFCFSETYDNPSLLLSVVTRHCISACLRVKDYTQCMARLWENLKPSMPVTQNPLNLRS